MIWNQGHSALISRIVLDKTTGAVSTRKNYYALSNLKFVGFTFYNCPCTFMACTAMTHRIFLFWMDRAICMPDVTPADGPTLEFYQALTIAYNRYIYVLDLIFLRASYSCCKHSHPSPFNLFHSLKNFPILVTDELLTQPIDLCFRIQINLNPKYKGGILSK